MYLVPRHAISRHTASGVEYYDGCEMRGWVGWSDLREDAVGFRTYAKAKRRADRVGGHVFSFQRFENMPDTFSKPIIQLSQARVA